MDEGEGIIYDRRLILCPATIDWSVPELIQECPECNDFLLYCCSCNNKLLDLPRSRRPAKPCHHFRVIFTDGACKNNGRPEAKAGVGVAYGKNDASQLSMPITDSADNFPLRSKLSHEPPLRSTWLYRKLDSDVSDKGLQSRLVAVLRGNFDPFRLLCVARFDWGLAKGLTKRSLMLELGSQSLDLILIFYGEDNSFW